MLQCAYLVFWDISTAKKIMPASTLRFASKETVVTSFSVFNSCTHLTESIEADPLHSLLYVVISVLQNAYLCIVINPVLVQEIQEFSWVYV